MVDIAALTTREISCHTWAFAATLISAQVVRSAAPALTKCITTIMVPLLHLKNATIRIASLVIMSHMQRPLVLPETLSWASLSVSSFVQFSLLSDASFAEEAAVKEMVRRLT